MAQDDSTLEPGRGAHSSDRAGELRESKREEFSYLEQEPESLHQAVLQARSQEKQATEKKADLAVDVVDKLGKKTKIPWLRAIGLVLKHKDRFVGGQGELIKKMAVGCLALGCLIQLIFLMAIAGAVLKMVDIAIKAMEIIQGIMGFIWSSPAGTIIRFIRGS